MVAYRYRWKTGQNFPAAFATSMSTVKGGRTKPELYKIQTISGATAPRISQDPNSGIGATSLSTCLHKPKVDRTKKNIAKHVMNASIGSVTVNYCSRKNWIAFVAKRFVAQKVLFSSAMFEAFCQFNGGDNEPELCKWYPDAGQVSTFSTPATEILPFGLRLNP